MKKSQPHLRNPVKADLIWAAACAAYRLNNGYAKVADMIGDQVIRSANKDVVRQCIDDTTLITDADREQAEQCRRHMASSVTMRALKTELQEWDKVVARICGQDEVNTGYDLAVISAMPHSYANYLAKEAVSARLVRCEDDHVGKLGDKVELAIEIVQNNYSTKFDTWFVSGITLDNHAVFFAYRESLKSNLVINIRGTVKRLVDRATQLNRVKIVGELA